MVFKPKKTLIYTRISSFTQPLFGGFDIMKQMKLNKPMSMKCGPLLCQVRKFLYKNFKVIPLKFFYYQTLFETA